jgi:hypothetical protein
VAPVVATQAGVDLLEESLHLVLLVGQDQRGADLGVREDVLGLGGLLGLTLGDGQPGLDPVGERLLELQAGGECGGG